MDNFPLTLQIIIDSANIMIYSGMLSLLPILTPLLLGIHHYLDFGREYIWTKFDSTTSDFDFIIVGGGTTGSLLAVRLSRANFSVLLLEAGGSPFPALSIPAAFTFGQYSSHTNYAYKTEPQTNSCAGLKEQKSYWPAGKGLGGTSSFNALIWAKGHTKDYDEWARLLKDERWSGMATEKYFKRVLEEGIHVEKEKTELGKVFLKGASEMGWPNVDTNADYDDAGFDHIYLNRRKGYRSGIVEVLQNARDEITSKLTIKKFATATKILFKKETKLSHPPLEVMGIEYSQFGVVHQAFAKIETVISAGAVESPKLLMLCGIGPKKHLQEIGIPVKLDLPVGENLQDHVVSIFGPHLIQRPITYHPYQDLSLLTALEFLVNGTGLLSTTGYHGTGYITTNKSVTTSSPNIQLVLSGMSIPDPGVAGLIEERCNTNPGVFSKLFSQAYNPSVYSFLLSPVLVKPKSRGSIRLRDRNPGTQATIDPAYFQEREDVEALVEGMQQVTRLLQTKAFKDAGVIINSARVTGCESHEPLSSGYFECYIKTVTVSGAHAAGTCAMGTVLDSELRVKGVRRLRVADASVMPTLPNANIAWTCFMIAERAAEFIIQEAKNK